ncbi:MAG: DUF1820 family protein [Wenzhouxiangellaceae bacterium]
MYKLVFHNQGKVYELFAERVESSQLYGFIEARKLLFEPASKLVVDPAEERMREEFADTEVLMLPMHAVIRVEQVRRKGSCAIRDRSGGDNVTMLPLDGPGRKK